MGKLSDKDVEMNMELVKQAVARMAPDRRKAMAKMFTTSIGEEFFTAPASAREDYHNCFPGGLCDHSIRVVNNLSDLAGKLCPKRYETSQLEFLGIVHDLGKAGDVSGPYYVPNPSEWHRNKGMLYETNRNLVYMPTIERTLFNLQAFGITLSSEEYLAIRLSDGLYDETNKKFAMKEPDLALLLHWADRWASSEEKGTR